jgi:hypothetical protein
MRTILAITDYGFSCMWRSHFLQRPQCRGKFSSKGELLTGSRTTRVGGVMSGGSQVVVQPMMERFVYGLFYPAILGANLILLLERAGKDYDYTSLFVWDKSVLLYAWALTLLLFIFDYVSTAPLNTVSTTDKAKPRPPGIMLLSIIDFSAAAVFFYAQTKIVTAAGNKDIEADWSELWYCLLFLHILYLAWYLIRLFQSQTQDGNDYKQYIRYLTFQLAAIGAQLILFFVVSWILKPIVAWSYVGLVSIAILGWGIRQFIETKYA